MKGRRDQVIVVFERRNPKIPEACHEEVWIEALEVVAHDAYVIFVERRALRDPTMIHEASPRDARNRNNRSPKESISRLRQLILQILYNSDGRCGNSGLNISEDRLASGAPTFHFTHGFGHAKYRQNQKRHID